MTAYQKYLASLDSCRTMAGSEYKASQEFLSRCDTTIKDLSIDLKRVVDYASDSLATTSELRVGLQSIKDDLDKEYEALEEKRNYSLKNQKKRLGFFNVMLFGKTMSGKSTIREAITHGDGSTIGKGAQRTTRDVKEYEWNNLRIIDTPGFGAYDGKEDTEIAREILELSDVVLFLLNSDSIQDTTFTELEHVCKLNKPLIFVMNMKKDLESEGNRRRALKNPAKYIYKEDVIDGHVERLKDLAGRAGMNPNNISVVAIHAQSAFLANKMQGEESKQLHELSNIDLLLKKLQKEVEVSGPVRRVQTFLDSTLHHIDTQRIILLSQRDRLDKLLEQYESSLGRVSQWQSKVERDLPKRLAQEVDSAFKPLVNSIADFVDDHIESKSPSKQWETHCKKFNIPHKIEQATKDIVEEVSDEINEFQKEMNESLDITLSFEISHQGGSFDEADYRRINGWGAAITSVISSVAFLNAWNPVGWAAAGIAIAFSIFSFFSDSRDKKLKEAKSKQRKSLLEEVEKSKSKTKESLMMWFEKEIKKELVSPAKNNLLVLCSSIKEISKNLEEKEEKINNVAQEINIRLLHKVAFVITGEHFKIPRVKKIVRVPGYACYFIVDGYFRDSSLLRSLGLAMRENVRVVYDKDIKSKISHLYRGLVEEVSVFDEKSVEISVKKDNVGKVIGKDHRRIKMVAALCSCQINVISD
ncbi:GTPase [Vreelandella lionensis]|uniref:GTPase n=1 Tax=Vreelandella lionensis TaxID=1144478 RepID=A0ABW8BXG7_9GAMM